MTYKGVHILVALLLSSLAVAATSEAFCKCVPCDQDSKPRNQQRRSSVTLSELLGGSDIRELVDTGCLRPVCSDKRPAMKTHVWELQATQFKLCSDELVSMCAGESMCCPTTSESGEDNCGCDARGGVCVPAYASSRDCRKVYDEIYEKPTSPYNCIPDYTPGLCEEDNVCVTALPVPRPSSFGDTRSAKRLDGFRR